MRATTRRVETSLGGGASLGFPSNHSFISRGFLSCSLQFDAFAHLRQARGESKAFAHDLFEAEARLFFAVGNDHLRL